MFDISAYLARVVGINMCAIALALLIKPDMMRTAMNAILEHRGTVLLYGIFTTIFGSILINVHNEWFWGWPIVITIIGWIVFIRGLMRLFFSEHIRNFTHQFSNRAMYRTAGIISLLLSLFLLYEGFLGS